ncbi:hypothetical protein F511_30475 [Dorcoceras hygrometricum]|uniref:Uncharacterized protein n=1 Tax=Dorcoceras hygrometricum TaxID=472368 RepID=A0A2Z7BWF9_9LAMI|nr:hypothetical protein F511_30475 [Dorcoceras hygrometricum]
MPACGRYSTCVRPLQYLRSAATVPACGRYSACVRPLQSLRSAATVPACGRYSTPLSIRVCCLVPPAVESFCEPCISGCRVVSESFVPTAVDSFYAVAGGRWTPCYAVVDGRVAPIARDDETHLFSIGTSRVALELPMKLSHVDVERFVSLRLDIHFPYYLHSTLHIEYILRLLFYLVLRTGV